MKIVLILTILATGTVASSSGCTRVYGQQRQAQGQAGASKLEVSILPSKPQFRLNEQFKMLVMLKNSGTTDVYVLGTLEWGHLGSLLFHILDESGREIKPRAFPDDQTFVAREDTGGFVKLRPRHFLGTDFFAPLDLLSLDKPSKYSIYVEYHCPVSSTQTQLRPFWSSENDSVKSNTVSFEVVH